VISKVFTQIVYKGVNPRTLRIIRESGSLSRESGFLSRESDFLSIMLGNLDVAEKSRLVPTLGMISQCSWPLVGERKTLPYNHLLIPRIYGNFSVSR
jgi:hypothetical protein